MSDENKVVEEQKEHKCICQNENFRKFLVIALGTFVGVYAALCLFTATHRPPVGFGSGAPRPVFGPCPCKTIMMHQHYFKKHGEHFDKKAPRGMERKAPFEAQKQNDVDD
jgi:hypothetical protein